MIRLIIFDLDNTLTDFIRMKDNSIDAAVKAMIDSGVGLPADKIREMIFSIYDDEGIEYQKVFDKLLVDMHLLKLTIFLLILHVVGLLAYLFPPYRFFGTIKL